MNTELLEAVKLIEKEKGVEAQKIFEGLENSLLTACKSLYGKNENIVVTVNRETGDLNIVANKVVVDEVEENITEISLEDAKKINIKYELGDIVPVELDYSKFSRIAAQNAKNIMIQIIRDEERKKLYEIYKEKERTIVTGIVQRIMGRKVCINIGKIDAILPQNEQIPDEVYKPTQRIKVYINEVKLGPKDIRVMVSRIHPNFIRKLFESEVSEIRDGIVEIKAIAREAGSRTKMAVCTHDPNIDPVGACVGLNVARVNAIISELKGEKIDILNWCEDPKLLIENALSPANILSVEVDEENKTAFVVVPDYQLSLAIGKEGQNARLAARLTSYKIDIRSLSQLKDMPEYESLYHELVSDSENEE